MHVSVRDANHVHRSYRSIEAAVGRRESDHHARDCVVCGSVVFAEFVPEHKNDVQRQKTRGNIHIIIALIVRFINSNSFLLTVSADVSNLTYYFFFSMLFN